MRALAAVLVVWMIVMPGCAGLGRSPTAAQTRRVLIVTGEDYEGHHWRETTPVLAAALAADPRLDVEVLDDLRLLAGKDLTAYDALVLHFKNYDPEIPGRGAFEKLVSFADSRGGLVLAHFACGAFEEFRGEYEQLVGRVWFGIDPPPGRYQHDPYGSFLVTTQSADHPITRGLDSFETTDELYTCLIGSAPIEVLAEAQSTRDGNQYPMAFVTLNEQRRVFHCVLGHDVNALQNMHVAQLYRRATAWAAGLTP